MATATQRFESLYLDAVKQVCILGEQLELVNELNTANQGLIEEQNKKIVALERKISRIRK